MSNPKSIYNEFIRANLPVGITYDEVRAQYVTGNGKRFPTYLQAKWYLDYIIKFGYSPVFSVASLFSGGEAGVWYDPSDLDTLFQDTAGTTSVTTAGQTVGLMLDKSGNDLDATQATAAARPSYIVDADGTFIQHDLVDDALTVTLPDMGTEATVAYVTRSEVRLLEDQTISGSYTLPTQEIAGFVAIDRALTIVEKVKLIQYLASKVEGVNYGAEIDRLTLIAINAVDVFVYDTSKDSDGGAWRTGALAQASSWYNETLNTTTRGSRKEFPAVAVIVAEATKVTIYDGDDPALPMWAATSVGFTNISCVASKNGKLVLGRSGGSGAHSYDFLKGQWYLRNAVYLYTYAPSSFTGTFTGAVTDTAGKIVNGAVNDVAMTVLPDAPIDAATGLPVPTIACLVAETEVAMADGSTKRLDQVVVGDVVKTLEGEHSVLNWWDQGIKDVVELEFDGGQKITCTADHKIRTTEGWVEAGDLTDAQEVIGL